jgi:hypothetical protein
MSEQEKSKSFMQELDAWSNEAVIAPVLEEGPDAIERVQKAIREKVLQSYRNGQKAGPRSTTTVPRKEWRR